jgi:hypothetical protein
MTINYGGGTVTITELSAPTVGTPILTQYIPSPGTNGAESTTGGVQMGIMNTGTGNDSWEIQLAFSQNQQITVHNLETYTNFEDTILSSNNPWTQLDGSTSLNITGLGTNTISLKGVNGPNGPFGYGHWSTTTTILDMTYILNETAGGTAGNGIDIAVPEPTSISLLGFLCTPLLTRRRSSR